MAKKRRKKKATRRRKKPARRKKKAVRRKKKAVRRKKKKPARRKAKRRAAKRKPARRRKKKKAAKRKTARRKTTRRKKAKSRKKRKPNPAFMKPVRPDAALAAVIGSTPIPRTVLTQKLWKYIKRNRLQDPKNRRMIIADAKLRPVFNGRSKVNMFEMTKLVSKHVQ